MKPRGRATSRRGTQTARTSALPRFRRCFVRRLDEVRQEWHFLLIGWVLMPEHFHVLIKPEPAETTPLIMKGLKEESAKRILRTLRENLQFPWCRKTLARLRLPSTVHDESHYRLWQRRFYPFNVFSDSKLKQKLDHTHNNPVTRGLVSSPGDWPWSSWRFYCLEDESILRMDRMGRVQSLGSPCGRSQTSKSRSLRQPANPLAIFARAVCPNLWHTHLVKDCA